MSLCDIVNTSDFGADPVKLFCRWLSDTLAHLQSSHKECDTDSGRWETLSSDYSTLSSVLADLWKVSYAARSKSSSAALMVAPPVGMEDAYSVELSASELTDMFLEVDCVLLEPDVLALQSHALSTCREVRPAVIKYLLALARLRPDSILQHLMGGGGAEAVSLAVLGVLSQAHNAEAADSVVAPALLYLREVCLSPFLVTLVRQGLFASLEGLDPTSLSHGAAHAMADVLEACLSSGSASLAAKLGQTKVLQVLEDALVNRFDDMVPYQNVLRRVRDLESS
ncbi:hypothetical protein KIPB_005004 [Kipferlia bialata]|uniref:Uncharacterized protein n=1 Tax=Kipferlia bialata TaxID=797122 RepID=A0A391NK92_9EUKA|nr:hypothetical protein KIPB_003849 [Kipferlia bialata]GCA62664.1 hypothetical protein KIPB_005004 [Kipferlia bialata]|eukprot:g3849.t1